MTPSEIAAAWNRHWPPGSRVLWCRIGDYPPLEMIVAFPARPYMPYCPPEFRPGDLDSFALQKDLPKPAPVISACIHAPGMHTGPIVPISELIPIGGGADT